MVVFIPRLKLKVLDILNSNTEPMHVKDIAEKVGSNHVSMARMLLHYYKQGLVIRERRDMSKRFSYKISKIGMDRLEHLKSIYNLDVK